MFPMILSSQRKKDAARELVWRKKEECGAPGVTIAVSKNGYPVWAEGEASVSCRFWFTGPALGSQLRLDRFGLDLKPNSLAYTRTSLHSNACVPPKIVKY